MKLRKKKKTKIDKKTVRKMILAVVLFLLLAVDIIYVGFFRNRNQSEQENTETVSESSEIYQDETTAESFPSENEKESETDMIAITNLSEFAEPMLGENQYLLEAALQKFCPELVSSEGSAEIFYVTIPDDDADRIRFFVKISQTEKICELDYSWSTGEVSSTWSSYSESEILSESWNGLQPECRDEAE